MRKFLIIGFFGLVSSFGLFFCGVHNFLETSVSEKRMIEALQQALVVGSKTAALNLGDSSCELRECAVGYFKNELVQILVPDTIKNVLNQINSFTNKINNLSQTEQLALQGALALGGVAYSSISGLGKYGDSIYTALNRGAEKAAPKSVDVFQNAIFGMNFSDAKGILMGGIDTAATSYLHNTTYSGLKTAFAPIIKEPLDLLNPNKFWKPIASNYNSFASSYKSYGNNLAGSLPYSGLPEDLSSYLSEYATGKALDGLFLMVGKQESKLRADPWGTVSALGDLISDSVGDLLGDVFGKAKNNAL
jgi:hypothetical protein